MGTTTVTVEQERATQLLDAQKKAHELFEEIGRTLIRSGVTEKQISDEIKELGAKRHNVRTHWHKRVVRSGPNTLQPYAEDPPDRMIEEDDILFVDLGTQMTACPPCKTLLYCHLLVPYQHRLGLSRILSIDNLYRPSFRSLGGRFRTNICTGR